MRNLCTNEILVLICVLICVARDQNNRKKKEVIISCLESLEEASGKTHEAAAAGVI